MGAYTNLPETLDMRVVKHAGGMLRVELELALIDGSLQVADLPATWNAKM